MAITERKYFDAEYSTALPALTTGWAGGEADPSTLNTLFAPSLGTDFNNRVGRKVQVLSLKIRGRIIIAPQADQTAADTVATCRIIVVHDQQTNATQLNAEDVILSGAGSEALSMYQNPAFFGRFRVLKDKRYVLQNPNMTYDGTNIEQAGLSKLFQFTIKFRKPVIVHYNSTNGGTIADVVDNSFHIIAGAAATALAPILAYKVRTTFIDM